MRTREPKRTQFSLYGWCPNDLTSLQLNKIIIPLTDLTSLYNSNGSPESCYQQQETELKRCLPCDEPNMDEKRMAYTGCTIII